MSKNKKRQAKVVAQKRSYTGLIIGAILGIGAIALAVKITPVFSARQLVEAEVKSGASGAAPQSPPLASAIRGEPISPAAPTAQTDMVATPSPLPTNGIAVAKEVATPAVATNTAKAAAPEEAKRAGGGDEYMKVGFEKLSGFRFDMTEDMAAPGGDTISKSAQISAEIPDHVKAYNGKLVATKGFMLPVKVNNGLVTEFLLLKSQSACCYGVTPRINEWIVVRTTGKGMKSIMDEPITVSGRLSVGEFREDGYLASIYRMDAEKLEMPPNP
ncbi:MAG: hypothetical protein JWR19_102 [Pedosphaera sp.]|nr:hypothetical protein [Pedosphaera sp.]